MFQFPSLFDSKVCFPKPFVFGLTTLMLAFGAGNESIAQDVHWDNSSGGEFSDATNWDSGVPTSSDNAMFLLRDVYNVKLTSNATINSFQQTGGEVTLFGGNRLLANQESNFNSVLTLSDGGTEFRGLQTLLIGSGGTGSFGTVNVINEAEFNGANLFLGATADGKNDSGIGNLNISSRARVQIGNNSSGFNINGGQLIVSDSGANGNLVVRNGSTVNAGQTTIVGLNSGSRGTTEITGKDSLLTSQLLIVGYNGEGQLGIDDSALVSSSSATVASGVDSVGTVIVRGGDSAWSNSGQLIIGQRGDATLLIQDGADVTSGDGFLGLLSGSNGTATISGVGSNWRSSNLFMGATDAATDGGEGQLNIGPGAYLRVGNDASLRGPNSLIVSDSGANGILIVRNRSKVNNDGDAVLGLGSNMSGTSIIAGNGSLLTNTGDLVVGSSGNGRVSILDGASVSNANGVVASSGTSSGDVTVDGIRSIWNNSGDLVLGGAGNATMSVRNQGAVTNQDGFVGAITGGTGTATVKDAGSVWLNRNLFLGTRDGATDDGVGTVAVESGGIILVGNDNPIPISQSQLVVSDTDNNGKLHVRNGSKVTNDGVSIFGLRAATRGDAIINGTGSELNAGSDLVVGFSGKSDINVENGGNVSNGNAVLGENAGSRGIVNVVQSGSQWNTDSQLVIGSQGQGFMNVLGGGVANADFTIMGQQAGSESIVNVFGAGSQFNSTSGVIVGNFADAIVTVQDGGKTNTSNAYLGLNSGVAGNLNVSDQGSEFNSSDLFLGSTIAGTDGGRGFVNLSDLGRIHVGNDRFDPADSQSRALSIGDSGGVAGNLTIRNGSEFNVGQSSTIGGLAYVGLNDGFTGKLKIDGAGSIFNSNGLLAGYDGAGSVVVDNGGVLDAGDWFVLGAQDGNGTATVSGAGSLLTAKAVNGGRWGSAGTGRFEVLNGGRIESENTRLGDRHASVEAFVSGAGSVWSVADSMLVNYQSASEARLTISDQGTVSTGSFLIGFGGMGVVNVDGVGSKLEAGYPTSAANSGTVGYVDGDGTLNITNGGYVSSLQSLVGIFGTGNTIVDGDGSGWDTTSLQVGGTIGIGGTGTLDIASNGIVHVGNERTTFTGSQFVVSQLGSPALDANAGTASIVNGSKVTAADWGFIGLNSSAMGSVTVTGAGSELNTGQQLFVGYRGNGNLGVEDGAVVTSSAGWIGGFSTADGTATVSGGDSTWNTSSEMSVGRFGNGMLTISDGGEVSTNGTAYIGQYASGVGNVEVTGLLSEWRVAGELLVGQLGTGRLKANNSGNVVVEGDATINFFSSVELDDGFFSATNILNNGILHGNEGSAQVTGDIVNNGRIEVTGNSSFIIFDNLLHNGAIEVESGSSLLVKGNWTGASDFGGLGYVSFLKELRPGNSPAVIGFGGDVALLSTSISFFELAGTGLGEFDRLNIAGDLSLGGTLNVELIDGFTLGFNQEFLIADVLGSTSGQFTGLDEGDLVGNYGGQNLFISYTSGNGNGVSLFSAVPEPGSIAWLGLIGLGAMLRRRRQTNPTAAFAP